MKTITVAELIEILQEAEPTARVIFSTDYGDHTHTEQALPLCGEIEEVLITKTAYSNSGFAIVDAEDETGPEETYLVIR